MFMTNGFRQGVIEVFTQTPSYPDLRDMLPPRRFTSRTSLREGFIEDQRNLRGDFMRAFQRTYENPRP